VPPSETNNGKKPSSPRLADRKTAAGSASPPTQEQRREQVATAESHILLHETTLKSLHGDLAEVNRQIAAERANILRRKTNIELLERRRVNLRSSREESAALVRSVEQTLKKTMRRLRRRLGDTGGGGADPASGGDGDDAVEDEAVTAELPAIDSIEKGQGVVDEAAALLEQAGDELTSMDDSGIDHDVPASVKSPGLSNVRPSSGDDGGYFQFKRLPAISASIVPFHQDQDLMQRMWSMRKGDPSAPLKRASRDNTIGGKKPHRTGGEESASNFGGRSSALLPYLLPPVSTHDICEAVFTILEAEPTAMKSEEGKRDGSQLAAFLEPFLFGTCLDPLAVAGYDYVESEVDGDQSKEKRQQPGERIIDPTVALCPYELGGQCADQNCPYQHLDEGGQRKDVGSSAFMTNLLGLRSLQLPLSPSIDTRDFTIDDSKQLSDEQFKRRLISGPRIDGIDHSSDIESEEASKIDNQNKTERNLPGFEAKGTSWDGQTELDFVSLPKGGIEAAGVDDDSPTIREKLDAITDVGIASSSEEDSDTDEDGANAFGAGEGRDTPKADCLFWHSPPDRAFTDRRGAIISSIRNEGRGSVRVDDLLILMGFEVDTGENTLCLKNDALGPSDIDGPVRAIAAAVDAIQLCVHSGRYEVGYALINIAKRLASSHNDDCVSSSIKHAVDFIDEAAFCCTQTFGSNMFNVQVSFTILSQFLRSYCKRLDCSSTVDWRKLELDCYYIQDDTSSALVDNFSHLRRIIGSSCPTKETLDATALEAVWVQKLRSSLKNALASIGSGATSSPDDTTRQLIGYATIGNELASLLCDSTGNESMSNGNISIHSVVHLILDPAWDVIRRYVVKQSKAKDAGGQVGPLCLLNPAAVGCYLVGPMLFASTSVFFSQMLAERGPISAYSDARSTLDLDPKSKGTLTAISNFLNKCVRSLRRTNDGLYVRKGRDVGAFIAGDAVIAPLHSLCLAVTTKLSSFGQSKALLEEALAIPTNNNDKERSPTRTCLVMSELLWSQFVYSAAIARFAAGSPTVGEIFTGSDLAVKLLQYGINLRHVTLRGDAALVRQAVNGEAQALRACKQIVAAAFSPDGLSWVGESIFDSIDIDCVKLEAESSTASEMSLDQFPTSLLLMGNLRDLSFTGYRVKSLPSSFGYFYAHLEVGIPRSF